MYCAIKKSLLVLKIVLLMTPFVIGGYDIYITWMNNSTIWHLNTITKTQKPLLTRTTERNPTCDPGRQLVYYASNKGVDRIQMGSGKKDEILHKNEDEDIMAVKVDPSNGDLYYVSKNLDNKNNKNSLGFIRYGSKNRITLASGTVDADYIFIRQNGLIKELYLTKGKGGAVYKRRLPNGGVQTFKEAFPYESIQITDDWVYFVIDTLIVKYPYDFTRPTIVVENFNKYNMANGLYTIWLDERNFYIEREQSLAAFDWITLKEETIYNCNNYACYGPAVGLCVVPKSNKIQYHEGDEWLLNGSIIGVGVFVALIFFAVGWIKYKSMNRKPTVKRSTP